MNACLRTDHVAHLIVFEANDCVGNFIEPAQGFARLGVATEMKAVREPQPALSSAS